MPAGSHCDAGLTRRAPGTWPPTLRHGPPGLAPDIRSDEGRRRRLQRRWRLVGAALDRVLLVDRCLRLLTFDPCGRLGRGSAHVCAALWCGSLDPRNLFTCYFYNRCRNMSSLNWDWWDWWRDSWDLGVGWWVSESVFGWQGRFANRPHPGLLPSRDVCTAGRWLVIPSMARNLGCPAIVVGAVQAAKRRVENVDSRFLTPLRCVRNDRCRSCARVPQQMLGLLEGLIKGEGIVGGGGVSPCLVGMGGSRTAHTGVGVLVACVAVAMRGKVVWLVGPRRPGHPLRSRCARPRPPRFTKGTDGW